MEFEIKKEAVEIYQKLNNARYNVYFVGGCVRNLLTGLSVKDWDLTTNATPEQIQKIFPDSFYDNDFGTVGVKFEEHNLKDKTNEKQYAEITTFRTDGKYKDFRHPEKVSWGKTIEEDLARRDFTMNSIALKMVGNKQEFIDPFNGKDDIQNKIIRAVGNAEERFSEDALRILRAIRFASQLNFEIEKDTLNAIKNNYLLLKHISQERIRDEVFKILKTENAYQGIMLLYEIGILEIIFPELIKGEGISQIRPGRHHTSDVLTHNLLSLKECPSKDPLVKFATLLHDVGKPYVASVDENGYVIFYNHEVMGAKIAKDIAERLRLSKKEKEKVYTLIRWHMFTVDENITDSAVRRFIRRVGVENVKDMIDLRIGDRLGGGTQVAESWRLKKFKERLDEQLHPPFSINDMKISGNDVMEILKIKPGRKVGEILQKLFLEVDEDLEKNNKDYLLKRLEEFKS